jgi:hypothetical protein
VSSEPPRRADNVESRLAALEITVAKLATLVESGILVGRVAAPIAVVLAKLQAQHDYQGRFFALLDLAESLLKYAAAIGFAAAVQAAPSEEPEIMELFKQPPTLGKIAGMLRKIMQRANSGNADWPLDSVLQTFQRPNGKPTPTGRYLLDGFVSLRNAERGHGAHQPIGYYEDLYNKNHVIVEDCVTSSRFISIPLVLVHSVDHSGGQFAYRVSRLIGVTAIATPEVIVSPSVVRIGSMCLWDGRTLLLQLDDFVVYRYCSTCNADHVFYADSIVDQKVSLHSYVGNHRQVTERLMR